MNSSGSAELNGQKAEPICTFRKSKNKTVVTYFKDLPSAISNGNFDEARSSYKRSN